MATAESVAPHLDRLGEIFRSRAHLLAPPARAESVSQWAERNRILPKGRTHRPGPWLTESYQREIMDCILDPAVRRITLRKSTQVGGSEVMNNVIGYFIDADPKPIMLVQPTSETAKDYSNERIAPLIEHSPALRSKVRTATSRRAGNTVRLKRFPGGYLKITGANSGAGLRSHPIAVLLLDEVEAYPLDVNKEGDPVEIAERRTETFDDAKIFLASTPARPRGLSRIDAEYDASSQGLFHLPCPFCGFEQPLWWRDPDSDPEHPVYRLVFERDGQGAVIPESVRYLCTQCGQGIDEKHKARMLAAGRWIHRRPERTAHRGFHLNALYSPWKPIWAELAERWVAAKDNPEKLRAFVTLSLAETWDAAAQNPVEAPVLRSRAKEEKYPAQVPRGGCVLVAAADVQHNRIEVQVKAFGPGEESWLVDYQVFWGNPGIEVDPATQVNVWEQLDHYLLREWEHECGLRLRPAIVLIDSGAHADSVYDFVLPRQFSLRRIYACKGVDHLSRPGLVQESSTRKANIRLWLVDTYAAKDRIFARLNIPKPGPGYIHLPDWVTDDYLQQLTSERKITVRDKRTRTPRSIYVQTYARNEALDLEVYCHAGLWLLQNLLAPALYRDLGALAEHIQQGRNPATLVPAPARRVRTPGNPLGSMPR
ncbi:MAG TPA: phage terminase large subunit family protein [Terriglobales bacterium]|nr:phage terminase large subunit family protein [Terriglobales bacterium]